MNAAHYTRQRAQLLPLRANYGMIEQSVEEMKEDECQKA